MGEDDRERWDERYRAGTHRPSEHIVWLDALDHELPEIGHALDIAAGRGRIALRLARRGLAVTAVDISDVGLQGLRKAAAAEQLSIKSIVCDLEHEPLPDGPFDVIACFRYTQRDLWPEMRARLAPGGLLAIELVTEVNLECNPRPSPRHLVQPGETREACKGLEVLHYDEGWHGGVALACALARKPTA